MLPIVYSPGTNEPMPPPGGRPLGVLGDVANWVDRYAPGVFSHHTAVYPAQYANPRSYGDSRTEGELAMHALFDRLGGGRAVGFSQGAVVAGNVAGIRADVSCGYLLADALRPAGCNASGTPGDPGYRTVEQFTGHGVGGQRPVEIARWYSLPGDVITDAYPDSMIRDFADLTEFFGISAPGDAVKWINNLAWKVREKAWQNAPVWRRILSTPATIAGIGAIGGRSITQGLGYPRIHTSYGTTRYPGTDRTYVQQLAWDIARDAGAR